MTNTIDSAAPDLAAVKQRQQQAWASGDFAVVAARIVLVAEHLCDTADLQAGWRVLDVATGSGNAAIAAARRGCAAVGVDYVPALLERGRVRAAAERLDVEFLEGDAEDLPFPDASFDAVTSVFGAMFAPDHAQAAAELVRVCRPGGTIALASWTPDGFIGELFRTVAAHVPPPAGVQSPMLWGTEAHLRALFGEGICSLETAERTFTFRFRVGRGVRRLLPHLVRADAEGVRGARGRRTRRARAGSGRPRPAERPARRRGGDRDPGDVHRSRGGDPVSGKPTRALPQADASALVDRAELERQVQDMVPRRRRDPLDAAPLRDRPAARARLGYPEALLDARRRSRARLVRRRRLSPRSRRAAAGRQRARPRLRLRHGRLLRRRRRRAGAAASSASTSPKPRSRVATRAGRAHGDHNVRFVKASIDRLPFADASFDVVISNGVVNLSPVKHRVVRRGGPRAAAGRPARDLRHRQHDRPSGSHPAQHGAVGCLHRRRDPRHALRRRTRRGRLRDHRRRGRTTTGSSSDEPSTPRARTASRA